MKWSESEASIGRVLAIEVSVHSRICIYYDIMIYYDSLRISLDESSLDL